VAVHHNEAVTVVTRMFKNKSTGLLGKVEIEKRGLVSDLVNELVGLGAVENWNEVER
jgi:hypothetical protein